MCGSHGQGFSVCVCVCVFVCRCDKAKKTTTTTTSRALHCLALSAGIALYQYVQAKVRQSVDDEVGFTVVRHHFISLAMPSAVQIQTCISLSSSEQSVWHAQKRGYLKKPAHLKASPPRPLPEYKTSAMQHKKPPFCYSPRFDAFKMLVSIT